METQKIPMKTSLYFILWLGSFAVAFVLGHNHSARSVVISPDNSATTRVLPSESPAIVTDSDSASSHEQRPVATALPTETGRFAALALAAAEMRPDMTPEEFRGLLARVSAVDRPQLMRAFAEISDQALVAALGEAHGDVYSAVVSESVLAIAASRPAELIAIFAAHPDVATVKRREVVEVLTKAGQFSTAEQLAANDSDAAASYITNRLTVDPFVSPFLLVSRIQGDETVRASAVDAVAAALEDSPERGRAFVDEILRSGIATPASLSSEPGSEAHWRTLRRLG